MRLILGLAPFRGMVTAMDNAADKDVDKYLRLQLAYVESMAGARVRLARLSEIELILLNQIVRGAEIFGKKANSEMATQLAQATINPKSLNDALKKLRDSGIVTRVKRGTYLVEDHDIAALLLPAAKAKAVDSPH